MENSSKILSKLSFENISVVYNKDVPESLSVAKNVKDVFGEKKLRVSLTELSDLKEDPSFVITIGGDGTLLKTARLYANKNVPILGINLGRLGFLAQANPDEINYAAEKLISGEYVIQSRMMISADTDELTALNDIVVKGDTSSRTSKFFISLNDKIVCDYLADGIIVSTPTGSTAYTLSAGGPVLAPEIDAMVIVPICPHTLTARPLVVPSTDTIKISGCECKELRITADGQETAILPKESIVRIEKASIRANLVILDKEDNEFYSVLRKKLKWGVAPIN